MEAAFEDPITLEIMTQAVMLPCGHSFSKDSLAAWMQGGEGCCPVCKSGPYFEADVKPNFGLRHAIEHYLASHPGRTASADAKGGQGVGAGAGGGTSKDEVASPKDVISTLQGIHVEMQVAPVVASRSCCELGAKDPAPAVAALVDAFWRDPSLCYIWPLGEESKLVAATNNVGRFGRKLWSAATGGDSDDERTPAYEAEVQRREGLRWWFDLVVRYGVKHGRVWVVPSSPNTFAGAAVWQPDVECGVSLIRMLHMGCAASPFKLGMRGTLRVKELMDWTEVSHPVTLAACTV